MAKVRRGTRVKKGLKFFVYGKQGSRKSTFALDFAKMTNEDGRPLRVFYIDTEGGSIDNYLGELEDSGIDLGNLCIVNTSTYAEVEEYIDKAIDEEDIYFENEDGEEEILLDAEGNPFRADVIVLDSITPVQDTVKYGMIKTSEKRAKIKASKKEGSTAAERYVAEATAGMEFKDYDKLNAKGKNLFRSLVTRTNKYVCVVSREKDKTEQVAGDGNGFKSVKVGVMPDAPKGAEYEFFTVLHMSEDESTGEVFGQIERKDRTLTFERGEMIENPTPMLWQGVIDGNKDRKSVVSDNKKYDDIIEQESNDQYKTGKPSNSKPSTEADTETTDLNDAQSIVDAITTIRNGLTPSKKQALSANFTKANLPKQPKTSTEIETLVKMLDVAKSMQ